MPHKCQDPETHFSWLALCLKERRVNAEKNKTFCRVPVELGHLGGVLPAPLSQPEAPLLFPWTKPGFCVHMVPTVASARSYRPGFCVHTVPTVASARLYGPGFCVHTVPTVTSLLVRMHLWSREEQPVSISRVPGWSLRELEPLFSF